MDNRETLTASSRDAILKRHLFSGVAKNWIKGRGDVGRAYFVRRSSRQSFGFRGPLRAAQFLKPPALPGDTYSKFPWTGPTSIASVNPNACRIDSQNSEIPTDTSIAKPAALADDFSLLLTR